MYCYGFTSPTLIEWLGILGFVIAFINLIWTLTANSINIDASMGYIGKSTFITIYNNSTRKVTVTNIILYTSKYRWFSKKEEVTIPFGCIGSYIISPYESEEIEFKDECSINLPNANTIFGDHIFIKIWVSGKPVKTVRLTASRLSTLFYKITNKEEPFIHSQKDESS